MKKIIAHGHCMIRITGFIVLTLLLAGLTSSAQGGDTIASERAKAIIMGKGKDVLSLEVHGFKNLQNNRLSVPYNPMIYDVDGTALTLDSLKIPCEAYVEYRAAQGEKPQLFKLEVQQYFKDANSYYTELALQKKPLPQ